MHFFDLFPRTRARPPGSTRQTAVHGVGRVLGPAVWALSICALSFLALLPAPRAGAREQAQDSEQAAADQAHEELFLENRFPSATTCRTCHPEHFEEWSVSAHAYAQMSPVFNAMQAAVLRLTNGTNGDFCLRCHTPIGMNLGEPLEMSNMDRHPTSREGITCIACHRVSKAYGKISGRLAIVEGSIFDPVYGPTGDAELKRVLANPDDYKVVTDPSEPGRAIHTRVVPFFQLSRPGFCGTCHDVTLLNGFRLEEAFSEFKHSPAAGRGATCQDCHMGKEPGVASGYREAPAAIVGGVPTQPRKRTDHHFPGPDYSVLHPALFPFNDDAQQLASMRQWIQFDWKAGWGTDDFEDKVAEDFVFPEHWQSVDDRYDAREIIEENLGRLERIAALREKVLQAAYQFGEIKVTQAKHDKIKFKVQVKNATDGHNAPTGFINERLVWLHTTVTDREGTLVFESGDLDPNGDLRDTHSLYVHNGELPPDKQLFNLQSTFFTRNLRGGERDQVLPINYSVDPLPFIRPDARPTILQGRTLAARVHKRSIGPLGHRWHEYKVGRKQLTGKPPYQATIELKVGMIPVNLLAEIMFVGFDYNMSPAEVARAVVDGHQVLWKRELTIDPGQGARR